MFNWNKAIKAVKDEAPVYVDGTAPIACKDCTYKAPADGRNVALIHHVSRSITGATFVMHVAV